MPYADSYLKCTVCGRESKTLFAHSLRHGWPKCCGYTMRLERTDADIEAAVGTALGDQLLPQLRDHRRRLEAMAAGDPRPNGSD